MVCIYCKQKTQVINSRSQKKANNTWRRRQCLVCDSIWTTIEAPDLSTTLLVNKDGRLEPFSRDNLLMSVYDSCRHRKTAQKDATALTTTIVSNVLGNVSKPTIDAESIKHAVHEVLSRFDYAAGIYYEAHYMNSNQ